VAMTTAGLAKVLVLQGTRGIQLAFAMWWPTDDALVWAIAGSIELNNARREWRGLWNWAAAG
jgi:hypothetical protein